MKRNDWSTRKIYGINGILIKMEHTYHFQNQYKNNSQSCNNNSSKYVYRNEESPQYILQKEKSMYRSDLEFPYPWREKLGANLGEDSDEEKKIKVEWFEYVKSKRLGKNWKTEKRKLRKEDTTNNRNSVIVPEETANNRNLLVIHREKDYKDWVKRKTVVKKSFITFKFLSKSDWNLANHTNVEFRPNEFMTNSSFFDELPYRPEVFSNVSAMFPEIGFQLPLNGPNTAAPLKDIKFAKENITPPRNNSMSKDPDDCDLEVPNNDSKDSIESPLENFTKAELPKLDDRKFDLEMDSSDCLIERRTIFKNPTIGKIKSIRSDMEAVLTAKWENKNVDIIFFNWVFIPKGGEKLTMKDSLKSYLKVGQVVNFHGARTIPDTDKYETFLVYDGNTYPSLAIRSGYDLKKWAIDKDLYTFPRRAVVKKLILPYHAVVEVEAPARNLSRKITSLALESCFVNKFDNFHPEGWIDEFVKVGDKIYVELMYSKSEGSASIRKAWKFPEERILTPRPITSPNFEVPKDKAVFPSKEGKKSVTATVTDIFIDRGICLTKIKEKTCEIHFDEVYIDGYEATLEDLQVGSEITLRNFRKPPACEEFWTPLVWKGPQPSMHDLMRQFEAQNHRDAVVDFCSIYVGVVERYILPSHAVIKTKSNNDLVIFVSVSKNEILPEAPDHIWIDKIITMNDVLTFKIKKINQDRYTAVQVYI